MLGHHIARLTQSRHAAKIIAASAAGLAIVVGITVVAVSGDDAPRRPATSLTAPTDRGTTTSQRVPPATADRSDRSTTTTNSPGSTTTLATSRSTNGPGTTSASVPTPTSHSAGPTTTTLPAPRTDLEEKYAAGWTAECTRIWALSIDGKMYDPDTAIEVPIAECLESLFVGFLTAATPSTASEEGREDARTYLELTVGSGVLCWIDPSTEAIASCYDPDTNSTGPPPVD